MNRAKSFLTIFSFVIATLLIACSNQDQTAKVSGKLVTQTGEVVPEEFSVMLCPIRITLLLQEETSCSQDDSPNGVSINGEFTIKEVPNGRYRINLSPAESSLVAFRIMSSADAERFSIQVKNGQDLDIGEFEVPESYFD